MIKVILPESFGFQDPVAALVPYHSRGIDTDWMVKRAGAEYLAEFNDIKPDDNHSLIHLIAMGATDRYGSNRNGDAFFKHAQELDLVAPNWTTQKLSNGKTIEKSAATFADRTENGLVDRYQTFKEVANVYKHHKNRPQRGDKIWGSVKAAAYNHDMDRVELLISVDNDEWRDDLEKLASGGDIPFSMACVLDPSSPVLTSRGYVPIVSVAVGDQVLTHHGNWKKVSKVLTRSYSGEVIRLSVKGNPFALSLTVDHPLMVIPRDAKGDDAASPKIKAQWVHAGHLKKGDTILTLAPANFPNVEPLGSPYFCAFLGEVLCSQEISKTERDIAERFLGKGLNEIYTGLFNSDPQCQMAFLGALIDSGNTTTQSDYITWATPDAWVAMQVRDLFGAIGIPAKISQIATKIDGGVSQQVFELQIPFVYLSELAYFSEYVNVNAEVVKALDKVSPDDMHYPHLFSNVEVIDATSTWVVNQTVYNLEVEDDESYLIAGMVSHNCRVKHDICSYCGNKAKSTEGYCDHLKTGLTDLLKTGHVVAAVNDHATYFDISRVNRPADRIAWSLTKAASGELVRSADLALDPIYGLFPDNASNNLTKTAARLELLKKLAEIEKQIPVSGKVHKLGAGVKPSTEAALEGLAGKHTKTASILGALTRSRVVLPLEEFAELILGRNEKTASAVAEASKQLPGAFGYVFTKCAGRVAANDAYDPDMNCRDHIKTAQGLEEGYSWGPDAVSARAIRHAVSGELPETIKVAKASEAGLGLLEEYVSYKLAAMDVLGKRHPGQMDLFMDLCVVQNQVR